jgi:hypothetical protein
LVDSEGYAGFPPLGSQNDWNGEWGQVTRDTVCTRRFSRCWDIPQRVLRSSVTAVETFEGSIIGEQMVVDGTWCRIRRFGPVSVTRSTRGCIEAMMLSAG